MSTPPEALDIALTLAKELEQRDVPYAIGGALAYGIWGIPRATNDVDLNVFVGPEELPPVFEALRVLNAQVDVERFTSEAIERGMFECWAGPIRIDVFTPSIEFANEAERTRALRQIDGERVYFLSAEALSVFKLLFFRPKDLVDLERLLAVQRENLDAAYVRQQLVQMMGESDERVLAWDSLVSSYLEQNRG
jgi:hypothetical protein